MRDLWLDDMYEGFGGQSNANDDRRHDSMRLFAMRYGVARYPLAATGLRSTGAVRTMPYGLFFSE